MEEKNLESWADFKKTIEEIREQYGYHEYSIDNQNVQKEKKIVLFRGQRCAEWPLQTTLERSSGQIFSVMGYLTRAKGIQYELEAYTQTKWDLPDNEAIQEEIVKKQDSLFGPPLPCYDYLVYLRHHGYPSPLLDWSESPYVAAYFALCEPASKNQRVAVFAYIYALGNIRGSDGGPTIKLIGPNIRTHKRHFLQKAWYTFASKWSAADSRHFFCSHHEIFDRPPSKRQDILIKITLPVSERRKALQDLNDYNINHFTLFQTEDALVKKLGMQEFDIDVN